MRSPSRFDERRASPGAAWWRPRPWRWLALGLVASALGTGVAAASDRLVPEAGSVVGIKVAGRAVETGGDLDALARAQAEKLRARRVEVRYGQRSLGVATLGDLGVRVDTARVVAIAREQAPEGDALARVATGRLIARGGVDVPLAPTIDAEVARPWLTRVKDAEDRPPVSARLDLEHHGVTPEQPGHYVDLDGAIGALAELARGASLDDAEPIVFDLPVAPLPPRVTSSFVRALDVHTVLATYETYFSRGGDQARRAENIDVAAGKLDGLVLFPDELVSFNRVVGERSEENGFKKSWEIFKGEMQEGVGGGTCQVASTLHATAFFAGLEILERLPHSRPSAYIPIGLDATVVYPVVDMKLKNPYPFPVVLHTKVEGNRVKMELLGKERPARVAFSRELLRTYAYGRKVEEKEGLSARHVILKQHGIKGFRVKRKRLFTFTDGKTREEATTDLYPPTSEVYEVPPGFDVSLLPPLPADDVAEDLEHAPADAEGQTPTFATTSATALAAPPSTPPTNGAPTSPGSATTSAAGATPAPTPGDLVVEVGRGAHAPTALQANPPRTMTIKR